MAYDSFMTADDFIGLKSLVSKECSRRNQMGSVANLAGGYSSQPQKGKSVKILHYNELYRPLSAINNSKFESRNAGDKVTSKDMNYIAAQITELSRYGMSPGAATGCMSSCTGLCTTGCSKTCTGCSGGCTGGCYGCSGGCGGNCESACQDDCGGGCRGNCQGGCEGGCNGGCKGCGGDCTSACGSGCGSACQLSNCQNTCVVGCSWTGKPECVVLKDE